MSGTAGKNSGVRTFHVQKKYPGMCIASMLAMTNDLMPSFMSCVHDGHASHGPQSG